MKDHKLKILCISTLSLAALLFSLGSRAAEQVKIPENHCAPRTDSKRYVDTHFSTSYPRTVVFECTYDCRVNGRLVDVVGTKNVTVRNMQEDATDTGCQGVKVKKVSWGWDFDGVEPFYAYQTAMPELKRFAFENISQKNATETKLLTELKSNLQQVTDAYKKVGWGQFKDASDVMDKIIAQLPGNTTLLDKYIKQIVDKGGDVSLDGTGLSLVLVNLKSSAAWRIPSHLF